MFIFGSENEINDVIQYFKPGFPQQHLGNAGKECFYVFNEVPVFIRLIENGKEYMFTESAKQIFEDDYLKEIRIG